jgi:hypothetical protein
LPLLNSHHRCWCDTGPKRAAYWPWGDQGPRESKFKSFGTGTQWIFTISSTILLSAKLLMFRLKRKLCRTSPLILCQKMKWRPTTVKNPFLWRQLKHCSVQVCCSSSGCSKTLSTMRCLLASRQSRTRSTLWGLASSFRSQSRSISPRFSCPNVEKIVSNLCLP